MNVRIKSVTLENFKGAKNVTCDFGLKNATISGANATGKTTIFDSVWWVLFNKDSLGNEKFSIRPLDANGQPIHNLEIKVTLVLDVDGREMEISKTQKEKWVKKRGSDTAELQGNENLYEINGYPKTEKDYKLAISDLVSEEVFKMLTSPTYFPSLKWKEQRDILMRFVSEVNDYDLANAQPLFAPLLNELYNAPSLDDIRAKFQKALNEWKKKQAEIPVRIDEAQKSRVVIDVAELELGKKAVLEMIKHNHEKQRDFVEQCKELTELSDGILELKFKLGDLERDANAGLIKERRDLHAYIDELEVDLKSEKKKISMEEFAIKTSNDRIAINNDKIKKLREDWTEENSTICPYCKQDYPEDKKTELRDEFASQKARQLSVITEKGNALKQQIDLDTSEVKKSNKMIESMKKKVSEIEAKISDSKEKLSKLPTSINVSQTDDYKTIQSQIKEKEAAISKFSSVENVRKELSQEAFRLQEELTQFELKIASASRNSDIDERIEQLQEEQRVVGQKVANQEKMLYLLEEFIRYKMDKVSEDINSKFDGINFKLFENQINGGLKETCECTVNGVNYASLNNGHRIVAGLQIIKALQTLYDVKMPIFTDNAESINDFNLPQMDCQLVLLKVSDEKELRVF